MREVWTSSRIPSMHLVFIGVQVKALSKRDPAPLGKNLEKCMGDFWIIVNKVATSTSAFILLPSEVKAGAHRGEKDGRVSFWLQPANYEQEPFREAWQRIGLGTASKMALLLSGSGCTVVRRWCRSRGHQRATLTTVTNYGTRRFVCSC
jgi:hypothetical protein